MPTQPIVSVRPTLEIDGAPQPALDVGLVTARIEHGLDHAAEAVLVFHLPMPLDGAPAAAVFATVKPGPSVRLRLGPDSPALFSGEIVAVTQDLRADRPPRLELVARDHLAALGLTALTMAYLEQTPLDVIRVVAARHLLRVASEIDGGALRETTVQAGETDLAFIRRLALELDGALVADGQTLRLARRAATGPSRHRLAVGETLRWLRLTADATVLPERLTVQGWDPETQQSLTATRVTSRLFAPPLETSPSGQRLVADPALAREGAVAARLQALLAPGTRQSMTATGSCSGVVPLRPGDGVEVTGVGPWTTDLYAIEAVSHDFSVQEGWQSAFLARLPPPDPERGSTRHADRDRARRGPDPRPGRPAGRPGTVVDRRRPDR